MIEFHTIEVELKLSIGFAVGKRNEKVLLSDYISEEEWRNLDLFEKQKFVEEEILEEWANEYIDKSAEVLE